ncbi:MAG: hypothetical protein ACOZF0_11170 [Thermodesulfobacteriota bacterium]
MKPGRNFLIPLLLAILEATSAGADADLARSYLSGRENQSRKAPPSPGLLRSYEAGDNAALPPDLADVAFVYDNALVLLACIQDKSPESRARAGNIAAAFVHAMTHDRYFQDGRLRNAYSAECLIDPQTGKTRLPGWWADGEARWREDRYQAGTHTGNMAWVVIALSQYHRRFGGRQYKEAAVRLGNWIHAHTNDNGDGYRGGFEGWEPDPERLPWKSTEHNIDVHAAFTWLHRITGDNAWKQRAASARRFVNAMWSGDHFLIGTKPDGRTPETGNPPLDAQAWAVLVFGGHGKALAWAERNCLVRRNGQLGFDFNTYRNGIWHEGTAHMALAYRAVRACDKAAPLLDTLRAAQSCGPLGVGKGIAAAAPDHIVDTGLGWRYFPLPHIGATAWYVLAEMGINPFLGSRLPCPPADAPVTSARRIDPCTP